LLRRDALIFRLEFTVAAVALVGVILFGILNGVLVAAVASILLLLHRAARPHVAFLGHYFLDDLARLFQSLRINIHERSLVLAASRISDGTRTTSESPAFSLFVSSLELCTSTSIIYSELYSST
jgi:hypothetical protein